MDTYNTLKNNMLLLAHNPGAMLMLQLNQLQAVENDTTIELRDPTDPVVFLAEMGVVMGHATIQGNREILPKMYPSMAKDYDDLFRHMSDVDYVDVFAQPASTELLLYIDVDSLISKAMPLVYEGVRKVVIPRDTVFTVSGYNFAIQYPIEIRVLPYGTTEQPAFQVVWLTDTQSPITPVSTNALEWSVTSAPSYGSAILGIKIPALQYSVSSENNVDTIAGDTQFVMTRPFSNQFFYARIWMMASGSTKWTELNHTHSRDVYDVTVPTALVQVLDGSIRCVIPSVYLKTGLISGTIRMDIYTTLGPLNVDISGYPVDEFTFALRDYNAEIDATYYNPIETFAVKQLAAQTGTLVSGGRSALTFEQLRARLIDNSVGTRKLPITEKQAAAAANNSGLQLTVPVSYVTGRIFHLSAPLPASTVKNVSSPMGSVTAPLFFTWDELAALSTVRVNGNRLTVLPTTVYKYSGTSLTVDASMTELRTALSADDLINQANAAQYMFTPFYYVIDINNQAIDARVYQLDKPEVTGKRFVVTNVSTELSVVSDSYEFEQTEKGYVLRVLTKSESSYQNLDDSQCFAQISYTPRNYVDQYAYINGTLVGKRDNERVWEFLLETNLDVDRNDELVLTNTRMTSANITPLPLALDAEVNLFFGVTGWNPKNYERATMDTVIVPPARDAIGVTHEIFSVRCGKALTAYWRKPRPVTDSINYKYYQADELAYYEEDVYKLNPTTGVPMYTVDNSTTPPTINFVYEHRKGDPVLNDDGTQKVAHRQGDLVLDSLGQSIIDKPRSLMFRNEMPAYDARYMFADAPAVQSYVQSVVDFIVNKVTVVIPTLTPDLIDQTDGFFVPLTTMGYISARTEDGAVTPIPAENRFTVYYYMTAANRKNTDLIKVLRTKTSQVINDYLHNNITVSATALGKALENELESSIISVEIGGMGPDEDWRLFTVVGDASQATIGKKLELLSDGTISLKDDILISYNRHDTDAS